MGLQRGGGWVGEVVRGTKARGWVGEVVRGTTAWGWVDGDGANDLLSSHKFHESE